MRDIRLRRVFPEDTVLAIRKIYNLGQRGTMVHSHEFRVYVSDAEDALVGMLIALGNLGTLPDCPPQLEEALAVFAHSLGLSDELLDTIGLAAKQRERMS